MKPPHSSEDILPIADVEAPKEFDRLTYRARFLDTVGEGLADAEAGRVVSDEALGKLLDGEFGKEAP